MATENVIFNTTSAIHTGIIANKLQESLILLDLRTDLYILTQKAATLNTYLIVREFLEGQ
jgi:hypothetical protein